jgi:penicillin amidase
MSDTLHAIAAVLLALLLVVTGVGAGEYVRLGAPLSGEAWTPADGANPGSVGERVDRAVTGPVTVESPYGAATVRYDRDGVPHIEAENEQALAFAVGYVQARDRLFQMDLQRRLMAGNLSAAFGEQAVESDTFHRQMGFRDAADASWRAIEGGETAASIEAYSAGVNHYIETQPLPLEFRLNDYEPTRWTPQDALLVAKLVSWSLSGSFDDLRGETVAQRLPAATDLYPRQLGHSAAIVASARPGPETARLAPAESATGDSRALYESLARYEAPAGLGSNSWVVSSEHTASGAPLLANDPHLSLMVPPVWYEMHLRTPEMNVRGVAFPGINAVVIGQNERVAWGFTNVGADQTDLYRYDWVDADTYRYRGEDREVQTHTETIPVKDATPVEVEVRRTVHGPLLEREGSTVAVAWVGLTGTKEAIAIDGLNHARSVAEAREVMRDWDSPTQNFVAMDRDGGTYFRITGEYPVRTVDGESVAGNRVFDGSAGEGEWAGFVPYGQSSWEGFVPYDEVPERVNPDYVATANQRTMDDPPFYIATSAGYADPYRGQRINELVTARIDSGKPVTKAFFQSVQRDTRSTAADQFVPHVLAATDAMDPEARAAARTLGAWDHNMTADSEGALLFALFRERYMNLTLGDEYRANGLDESYFPHYWTLGELPADSPWFDDIRTPAVETRDDIAARALAWAVAEADRRGYETYGDYNRLDLAHPFPVAALDYPTRPMDGSAFTVDNFHGQRSTQAGSSWRMVASWDGSLGVIPGGQSGNYYSPHYHDQLDEWAAGEYRPLAFEASGPTVIVFEGGDGE